MCLVVVMNTLKQEDLWLFKDHIFSMEVNKMSGPPWYKVIKPYVHEIVYGCTSKPSFKGLAFT